LLLPTSQGEIRFLSLPSKPSSAGGRGGETIYPFLPPQRPGAATSWLTPTAIDDQRCLAGDREGNLYALAIDAAGEPHLSAMLENQIPGPLITSPMIAGEFATVIQRNNQFDALVPISLSDLQPTEPLALAGRCRWGPCSVGDLVLLATDPGGLVAVQSPAVEAWTCTLNGELPIGQPLASASSVWIATSAGRLIELARDTGEVVRQVNLGEPLGSGPAIVGHSIVVRAADGTLLLVEASP
jgi:outer membrane protein assembly factor BamB